MVSDGPRSPRAERDELDPKVNVKLDQLRADDLVSLKLGFPPLFEIASQKKHYGLSKHFSSRE